MKKIYILPFFLLSACSQSLPETQVLDIFARHSYEEHSPEKITAALKGGAAGLSALDPRAAVLSGKKPMKARPSEKNYSSGLLIGPSGGAYKLLKVFRGSPAAEAGFRDGDEVLAVNGGAPSPDVFKTAIGRNTSFSLTAGRAGASAPLEADIPRSRFFFPQIFSFYDGASRSCFLRLGLFYEGSSSSVIEALGAAASHGAEGVILDLRDNQGGVPAEAAAVLKAFASKPGTVFELRSRHPGYASIFTADKKGRFAGLKAVVLVNAGTSMAAEVFARAMKDVAGAVMVGETTSASVSLTRAFALGDGRGLELTIARMFPPSGLDMESAGAAPDFKAGEPGAGRIWDNSREITLLEDAPYRKALELLKPVPAAEKKAF